MMRTAISPRFAINRVFSLSIVPVHEVLQLNLAGASRPFLGGVNSDIWDYCKDAGLRGTV